MAPIMNAMRPSKKYDEVYIRDGAVYAADGGAAHRASHGHDAGYAGGQGKIQDQYDQGCQQQDHGRRRGARKAEQECPISQMLFFADGYHGAGLALSARASRA